MNKKKALLCLVVSLIACGLVLASVASALNDYDLGWNVIGGGGATMSGGDHQLSGTVGQVAIGWSTNDHQLGSGFWYGVSAPAAPTCPDAYEPNEDFVNAKPITPGVAIQAYICSATDEDWFKFNVAAGQEITVDLTNLPKDYDLALYDPGNSLIGESSLADTADEHIKFPGNGAGAYRVYVRGFGGRFDTANPYTLLVQLGGAPPAHKIYLPVVLKRR